MSANSEKAEEIQSFIQLLAVREKMPGAPGRSRPAQRKQFRSLLRAEVAFVAQLRDMDLLPWAYDVFLTHIHAARNTLAARPFFRERHTAFVEPLRIGGHIVRPALSDVLRESRAHDLDLYHLNARFALLVIQARRWSGRSEAFLQKFPWWRPTGEPVSGPRSSAERKLFKVFQRLLEARDSILVANLRLAVNRAKIFWHGTPASHLAPADFLQIAAEGMLSAVDKVVLLVADPVTGEPVPWDGIGPSKFLVEPGAVFCGVGIGRIVGLLVERFSETMIHFFPPDKKILYRANREQFRHLASGGLDYDALAKRINAQATDGVVVDPAELAAIMAASGSPGSAGLPLISGQGEDEIDLLDKYGDRSMAPDVIYEDAERGQELDAIKNRVNLLPLLHQKLLTLRGVKFQN